MHWRAETAFCGSAESRNRTSLTAKKSYTQETIQLIVKQPYIIFDAKTIRNVTINSEETVK